MSEDDATFEHLKTLGLITNEQVSSLREARGADPGGTWADTLISIGLEGASLADAIDAVEESADLSPLGKPDVTPEADRRYDAVKELGVGGMGRVDLVSDSHLHRSIARKALLTRSPQLEARFLREARITAQLEHPGIIPIYELGERADGTLYYTMKRVRGRTFREALLETEGVEDRLQLLSVFVDLCQAVGYAHSKGVVHRDLKPDNVMVGAFGETLVLDWGLAKVAGEAEPSLAPETTLAIQPDDSDLTRAGTVLGTPRYMSPEQASGEMNTLDARADVWSLGAMLHELLTGKVLFDGASVSDVLDAVRDAEVTPPAGPGIPPELAAIAMKALQKKRVNRYPDGAALALEVEAWRNGAVVTAHEYSLTERWVRFATRHRVALVAGVAVLLTVVVLLAGFIPSLLAERDVARANATRFLFRATLLDAALQEQEGDPGSALALVRLARTLPGIDADEEHTAEVTAQRLVMEGADERALSATPGPAVAVDWVDADNLVWTDGTEIWLSNVRTGASEAIPFDVGDQRIRRMELQGDIVFVGLRGRVSAIALADGAAIQSWDVGARQVMKLFPSPDGLHLLAILGPAPEQEGPERLVHVWSVASAAEVLTLEKKPLVAWSGDGGILALALGDLVHRYDARAGFEALAPLQHPSEVTSVAIGPTDGLATAHRVDPDIADRIRKVQAHLDSAGVPWGNLTDPPTGESGTAPVYAALQQVLAHELTGDENVDTVTLIHAAPASLDSLKALVPDDDPSLEARWAQAHGQFHLASLGIGIVPPSHVDLDEEQWAYASVLRDEVLPRYLELREEATRSALDILEAAAERGELHADWVGRARSTLERVHSREVLVTGAGDDQVRVWALGPGVLRNTLPGHDTDVDRIGVDEKGARVVTSDSDGGILGWDLYIGQLVFEARSDTERTQDIVAFVPGGDLVISGVGFNGALLWDLPEARSNGPMEPIHSRYAVRGFSTKAGRAREFALAPSGKDLAMGSQHGGVRVWSIQDRVQSTWLPAFHIMSGEEPPIIVTGDRQRVLVQGEGLRFHQADTLATAGNVESLLKGDVDLRDAHGVGDYIALALKDGRVGLLEDRDAWREFRGLPDEIEIREVRVSRQGIVAAMAVDGRLFTGADDLVDRGVVGVKEARWSPDGQRLAASLEAGFALMGPRGAAEIHLADAEVGPLAWVDDGRLLVVDGPRVRTWDASTQTVGDALFEAASPIRALFSSGSRIAVGDEATVTFFDGHTGLVTSESRIQGESKRAIGTWTTLGLALSRVGSTGIYIVDPDTGIQLRAINSSAKIENLAGAGDVLFFRTNDGLLHRATLAETKPTSNLVACGDGRVLAAVPFSKASDPAGLCADQR